MEQIRIDRGQRGMLSRRRRAERDAVSSAPLDYAAGAGADIDEDLMARIEKMLVAIEATESE